MRKSVAILTVCLMAAVCMGAIRSRVIYPVESRKYSTIDYDAFVLDTGDNIVGDVNITGDLAVSGSGTFDAITGTSLTFDFSTQDYLFTAVALDNSFVVQSQTAGVPFRFDMFSNDGDNTDVVQTRLFSKGTPSSKTDSEYLAIGYVGNVVPYNYLIHSDATGTGTVRPVVIYTGANTSQFILGIDGNNSMGGDLDVTGAITGGSLITGGDIGVSGDTDLFQLAANALTVNGALGVGVAPAVRLHIQTVDCEETSITTSSTNTAIRIHDSVATGVGPRWGISWMGYGNRLLAAIEPDVVSGWDAHLNFYVRKAGSLYNSLHLDEDGSVDVADNFTAGTIQTDTITEATGAAGVTIDSVVLKDGGITLPTTSKINFRDSDIFIGSAFDGKLDIGADISVGFFYDNAPVGDENDGQSVYINRMAAEGDDYLQFYIDSDRYAIINANQTLKIQRQGSTLLLLAANALTVNGSQTIYQQADSVGLTVYGYDNRNDTYAKMQVNKYGQSVFVSSPGEDMVHQSGLNIYFKVAANKDMYFDLGDSSGVEKAIFRDSGLNVIATIDSDGNADFNGSIGMLERSSDPTEPAEGNCVVWMSDGTGKGDDGDVLIASKAGGTTNWGTLFDHSGGAGW